MAIKYKWLADQLRRQIPLWKQNGISRLPSETELATSYQVSRQTVRQALALLTEEQLITKKQGSGSFLTGKEATGRDNSVALLITTDEEYLYPQLLTDLQTRLSSHKFRMEVFVTNNRIDREREILEELLSRELKPLGIISEGCKSALPNPNLDLYHRVLQENTPLLFLHNYYSELPTVPYIKDDNYQGSYELVTHLKELGHRHIAGIFPSDDVQGLERYKGYIETMRAYMLPLKDEFVFWFHRNDLHTIEYYHDTQLLRRAAQSILALDRDIPCIAVVCYNDTIAFHLIRELQRLHARVPEDVAVVSFDNSYLATAGDIGISSLSHDSHRMGHVAADTIIQLIQGQKIECINVPWTLKRRTSS